MTVADRIRLKREELNLSQDELAKRLGNKDKSTICKIEKSGDNITMKNIKRIADALGVSSQYSPVYINPNMCRPKTDLQGSRYHEQRNLRQVFYKD